jgi:hypothetical protein
MGSNGCRMGTDSGQINLLIPMIFDTKAKKDCLMSLSPVAERLTGALWALTGAMWAPNPKRSYNFSRDTGAFA